VARPEAHLKLLLGRCSSSPDELGICASSTHHDLITIQDISWPRRRWWREVGSRRIRYPGCKILDW
jgi:hypothetical protein